MVTLKDVYEHKQIIGKRDDVHKIITYLDNDSVQNNNDRSFRVDGDLDDNLNIINEAIEKWYDTKIPFPITMLYNRFILSNNSQLIKI